MKHSVPDNFLSYICGKLLGDGCIILQPGRKPRFQFIHTVSDLEWCQYCYEQLSPYLPLNPPTYRKTNDIRISKGFTESYMVQSKTSEIITYLESVWYTDQRKKIIPFDFLEKHLDERALAWWYLDDGHLKINNNTPKKIILSTDNFSNSENRVLIDVLQQKFSLYFSIDGQNRLILYDQLQIYYFYKLVKPFLHQSMIRKMINTQVTTTNTPPKRTTIYLPKEINLSKPTREINNILDSLPLLHAIACDRDSYIYYYKKYFLQLKDVADTKSYQIKIDEKHWHIIQSIKSVTGLNNSQIATICLTFKINKIP
ncbi:endonuclease [Oceanobacillus bengalensis]|uniref:Endonuclease n=1 Tax=Oceanobacillus bengalensis TaxID=1435466 RepID=A0A494YVQ5_9BACI|nr:endonuclease [Oceanobacillus bengalensis]RKQ14116.1 endonuclease [Oceanobacillus bengalensis]